ncbi:MAG TPA: thioredoxin domain-containing protein [Pseudolabrys sp.]|nr:thioredoxin domain-containing protein [Pseudolabrys sp.]
MQITRRQFCGSTATVTLTAALLGTSSLIGFAREAVAADEKNPSVADLMKPGALSEMSMGSDKAPVTIIEYASMTCPHCAHFEATTFPELKKQYIDTGKVRYILREFPLDPIAAAGFMLARCSGKDDKGKYFAMVETLFRQQREWAVEKPLQPLLSIAKQAGFTEQTFNACLANQKLLDGIEAVRQRAIDQYGVNSTPTFFINGKKQTGDISLADLEKVMKPYLKEG